MFILAILAISLANMLAKWRVYQKMGFNGWKSLIPLYSDYLMFQGLYGNGWRVLRLWLLPLAPTVIAPFIGIAGANNLGVVAVLLILLIIALVLFYIKTVLWLRFDLARAFHQSKAFGWGLIFANSIFMFLLGFSGYTYHDGTKDLIENDVISMAARKIDRWIRSSRKNSGKDAITLLKELGELHADGIITDEIYEQKKEELLKKI